MSNLYVDIHVLQTVPPSCVNRDDTGSPKTAVYGGTTRARVSSQSWKRAMRLMFRDLFDNDMVGQRTKRVVAMIAEEIKALVPDMSEEACMKAAAKAAENAGIKVKADKKNNEQMTDVLMFMSKAQAKALAELSVNDSSDKKEYKNALKNYPSADIALFGRMVASDPTLNYDAAAQVAHAISTHTIHNEYDYFTAVDDLAPDDTAGAGHLGTVEFNSSTLYRYATVNVNALSNSLGIAMTAETVRKFVEAFALSMPTGKQNTFANRTFPDFIYVTCRNDQPVNLCGAFEKPVYSRDGGNVELSVKAFAEYMKKVYANFATEPECEWVTGDSFGQLAESTSFPQVLNELAQEINKKICEVTE